MPVTNVRLRLEWSIGIVGLLLLGSGASVFGRVPASEKCAEAKAKAAALAVHVEVKCHAKAVSKSADVDAACLLKVETKLRASFAKADAKGVCSGEVDAPLAAARDCATTLRDAIAGDARCVASKLKAAGGKVRGEATCARKAVAKGPEFGAACLEKVERRFSTVIMKADNKSVCTGTEVELGALVDACVATLPPPRTCAGAGHPTCNGTCPDGSTCRPYEVFADGASIETGCSCVDPVNGVPCEGTVCGTDLQCPDPGFVCEQWLGGDHLACDHSICQPAMVTPTTLPPAPENETPCDGGEFPTCGGTCPDGLRCQSFEAFWEELAFFAGCLCVDPAAPRCEATTECDIGLIQFSHCADPSLTCLVTLEFDEDGGVSCSDARCGVGLPTTTSTSNTTTTSTTTTSTSSTTTSSTTTSTSTTTTTTVPCTSTPGVSGCFQDLGNCTVLDTCTGLQWEQKGTIPGPHHVDNRYVWAGCCEDDCQTLCQPNAAAAATCMAQAEAGTDGCTTECPIGTCFVERAGAITTVWDWINQLNAQNFAGHGDWRLASEAGFNPTGARELESILQQPCTSSPCIDPIFGTTANGRYWSRTADVNRSIDAWFVNFVNGTYSNLNKREPLFVRAVR